MESSQEDGGNDEDDVIVCGEGGQAEETVCKDPVWGLSGRRLLGYGWNSRTLNFPLLKFLGSCSPASRSRGLF
ncbi:hypothetical protein LEMLEM_LOCUS5406 [Lemmus lemmus]